MKAVVEKSFKGAPDGEIHARDFNKGDEVFGDLAVVAVREGWARQIADELPLGAKDAGAAPENKAHGNAPENKRGGAVKPKHK